jgi:hypothetical protein
MSFLKTLAVLAVGFAAAKGVERFQKAGGMAGMQDRLKTAGNPGGMADTVGQLAENMGMTGGVQTARTMAGSMGMATASAVSAGQSGFGSLMGMLTGATAVGTDAAQGMLNALPGGAALSGLGEDHAKLMIRAMIMAAKSDGTIDAEERANLMAHLTDASPAEIAFVEAEMLAPVDIPSLVAQTDSTMRAQVYGAAAMAVKVDSAAESTFLDQLATALGLDAAQRTSVHAATGV